MLRKLLALAGLIALATISRADSTSTTAGAYGLSAPVAGGTLSLGVKESGGTKRTLVLADPAPNGGGKVTLGYSATSVVESLGMLRAGDGTLALPGLSFQDDPDTGIYNSGANQFDLVVGGVAVSRVNNSQFGSVSGSVSSPTYSFLSDDDTGIYNPSAGAVRIVANGATALTVEAAQTTLSSGKFLAPTGSGSENAYSFNGDPNTGMYRSGVDEVVLNSGSGNFVRVLPASAEVVVGSGDTIDLKVNGVTQLSASSAGVTATFQDQVSISDAGNDTVHFSYVRSYPSTTTRTVITWGDGSAGAIDIALCDATNVLPNMWHVSWSCGPVANSKCYSNINEVISAGASDLKVTDTSNVVQPAGENNRLRLTPGSTTTDRWCFTGWYQGSVTWNL